MDEFPWRKGLNPAQLSSHIVSQQLNTDCHNGYTTEIIRKLAQTETYPLQHQSYNQIRRDVDRDSTNRMATDRVPKGVVLRKIAVTNGESSSETVLVQGRLVNELKGTLFYKGQKDYKLVNGCVGTISEIDFEHPFYWEAPTTEQILKVFGFCKQAMIDELVGIYRQKDTL